MEKRKPVSEIILKRGTAGWCKQNAHVSIVASSLELKDVWHVKGFFENDHLISLSSWFTSRL